MDYLSNERHHGRLAIFRSYVSVTLRDMWHHKFYAVMNIVGLSTGLAAALLIAMYVHDEVTYDAFHPGADRMYRLGYVLTQDDGSTVEYGTSGWAWARQLHEDYPEVESFVRVSQTGLSGYVRDTETDRVFLEEYFRFADPNFFEFFDLPLKSGDPATVLQAENAVVMSESMAEKYFGDSDPIGRQLNFGFFDEGHDVIVTGVMYDPPSNTHLQFDFVANLHVRTRFINENWRDRMETYFWPFNVWSYVRIIDHSNVDAVRQASRAMIDVHLDEETAAVIAPTLIGIHDAHFERVTGLGPSRRARTVDNRFVYLFAALAVILVLAASINYMNVSTARAVGKAHETGIRKAMGSSRFQLVCRFYLESVLLTILSAVLAVGLTMLALPFFNAVSGKAFTPGFLLSGKVLAAIMVATLAIAIISGSYPALYLSHFKPAEAVRGILSGHLKADSFRRSLVVVQFIATFALLFGSLTILRQFRLIQDGHLVAQSEQLYWVKVGGLGLGDQHRLFSEALERDARIIETAQGQSLPYQGGGSRAQRFMIPAIGSAEFDWEFWTGDFDFPKVFDLKIIAGRDFSPDRSTDSTAALLTEGAVRDLGVRPEDVLGQELQLVGTNDGETTVYLTMEIIGVFEDFSYATLRQPTNPVVLIGQARETNWLYVKVHSDAEGIVDLMKAEWDRLLPDFPFYYDSVANRLNAEYADEIRMKRLVPAFLSLAVLISILGLIALTSYTTEQRTREIGVRKTMGASAQTIIAMLAWHFLRLIAIAFVVAIPLAWFGMHRWLQDFVYRVEIGWQLPVITGAAVLVVALVTVSYHSIKAAWTNPAEALRYE